MGDMDPGTLISFLLYTIYISGGLFGMSSTFATIMKAIGSAERIFRILDQEPSINVVGGLKPNDDAFTGKIEFKNVCFSYPSRADLRVINDFNLKCEPSNVVALVGPSGAGKSTIISLLQRFYDLSAGAGSILIGDYRLKDLDPSWLKSKCALVSQEPTLFATSIRENITYGVGDQSHVPEADIVAAAKKANAHNFISSF